MSVINKVGLILSLKLTLIIARVSGEACLRALKRSSGTSHPPFTDGNYAPLPASNAVQAIITTYKFQCDCNITSWETYVERDGIGYTGTRAYDITFQVWRPSSTVQDDGCYSLVGENVFSRFSFANSGLVQLTPPSDSIITAQAGDVVGYYTNARSFVSNDGIQLERDDDYNENVIWFLSGADGSLTPSGDSACPYPVGTGRYLSSSTAAAPILRISTDVLACPASEVLPSPSSSIQIPPSKLVLLSKSFDPTESFSPTLLFSSAEKIPFTALISPAALLSPTPLFSITPSSPTPPSSTPFDGSSGGAGTHPAIFAVVVIPILLIAILVAVIAIIALLLKKKVSIKNIGKNYDVLDLSNPNYELPTDADTMRRPRVETDFKNQAKLTTTSDNRKGEEHLYEFSDDVGLDYYSQPQPLQYSYPDQKHVLKGGSSNMVDGVGKSEYGLYEEPVQLEQQASINYKNVFQKIGNYVLTVEQRHESSEPSNQASHPNMKFFTEDPKYWAPASTTAELYSQLATKKYREISRDQLRLEQALGSGQFGEVYKATWSIGPEKLKLAVKTLKSGASEEDEVKFLQEAAIMGQFRHRNVIKMYGVVTIEKPTLICLELLENGDLKNHLENLKPTGSKFEDFIETELVFLKFAKEIAAGMDYLSRKSFVHRDLAARNVLLDKYLTCKVADFGMARDLMDDTYYTSSGGKIPVKWTAPEAILYKKYSADSDVWSYGMVLFEIWSVGKKPFSTLTVSQTLEFMQKSFCQAPPPGCPRVIYELMVDCWNPKHHCRPSFNSICQKLNESPENLLYWSPSDDSLSSQVGVCGAKLLEAEKLYPDLQKKYIF